MADRSENQRPRKNRDKAKEKRLGYLFVAPSLLLIIVIAIWPVLQSFYFSLFDLRLNSPTKSETHLNYSIDLEQYLNQYPFLLTAVENEIQQEHSPAAFKDVKEKLTSMDKELQQNPKVKANYKKVNDKLLNYENVDANSSIVPIDKKTAESIQHSSQQIYKEVKDVSSKTKLNQGNKLVGLSSGLTESIVKPNFVGLQHYQQDLSNQRLWKALSNTVIFTIISVGIELILGMAIALLINKAFVGRGLIRATILIPWAIPTAVSALMWKFLYDGQNGVVAKIFESIGLVNNMADLLTTQTGAVFSIIFTDVWKTTPYMALLLLAGLQTIPSSLYEAAAIDGASKWKQFLTITLPLMKSSMLVALLFRTLDAFRVFDLIFVLTGGGPANSTETISVLAYKVMFNQTNFGDGSALSVIVFICVAIISMIYIKILGRDLLGSNGGKG